MANDRTNERIAKKTAEAVDNDRQPGAGEVLIQRGGEMAIVTLKAFESVYCDKGFDLVTRENAGVSTSPARAAGLVPADNTSPVSPGTSAADIASRLGLTNEPEGDGDDAEDDATPAATLPADNAESDDTLDDNADADVTGAANEDKIDTPAAKTDGQPKRGPGRPGRKQIDGGT